MLNKMEKFQVSTINTSLNNIIEQNRWWINRYCMFKYLMSTFNLKIK